MTTDRAEAASEHCPGCGLLYPPTDGSTHPYIGASPGCWARYGTLLAREYGDPALMRWHRLTVDAYTAQHPGVPGRQSAQSVHVHLAGLCLALERGVELSRIPRAMQRLADGRHYPWLPPPPLATPIGLPEAIAAADRPDYGTLVRAWAEAVWQAWSPHRETIRHLAEAALPSL